MLAHCTQQNQEPVQNNDGSGEIGLSVSILCIDADMLRSVDFEDVIKGFALAKSGKRTFWIVYCIAIANVCNRDVNEILACESVNNIDALRSKRCTCTAILQWSKKLCILACKRDPLVRDRDIWFSVRDETETFPRDRDETETFGNYVSRPSQDRDVETETTSLHLGVWR